MLCSIPTSGKSTSNWLTRLRSTKGYPSGADSDLDQFLSQHPSSNPNHIDDRDSIPSKSSVLPKTDSAVDGNPSEGKQLMFSVMNNVLAELFVMGGNSNDLPKIKCSRKQPNPRFCGPLNPSHFSSPASNDEPSRKNESASPVSHESSGVEERVKLVENVDCGEEEEEEEEEEEDKCSWNLSGFSRTEVTVIDTSFARWKFEKMLFRKKNVWKVRDKKGKALNCAKKKKRKSTSVDVENACGVEVKKAKVKEGQCGLSRKGNGGSSKQENQQSNKSDTFGKAMKKKQATLNLEKGSSSVVLIKSIPAIKNGSCPKSTQKQLKV